MSDWDPLRVKDDDSEVTPPLDEESDRNLAPHEETPEEFVRNAERRPPVVEDAELPPDFRPY